MVRFRIRGQEAFFLGCLRETTKHNQTEQQISFQHNCNNKYPAKIQILSNYNNFLLIFLIFCNLIENCGKESAEIQKIAERIPQF
jgi:hypothetical protein